MRGDRVMKYGVVRQMCCYCLRQLYLAGFSTKATTYLQHYPPCNGAEDTTVGSSVFVTHPWP